MAACNPNEFGFDVIFAWEDDQNQNAQTDGAINRDDITCAICLLVLKEPVQAVDCGHRFCTKCIGEFHLINPGKCPKDWQDIQVFPDVGKKREILSLKIRCKNFTDGCKWQNELREEEDHLKNCGYESVACQLECGEFVLRKNIQNHMDTVCPCVSPCEYQDFGCTFKGTKESLQNHMAKNVTTHISLEMKLELQKVKDEFNKQLRAKDQEMVRVKNELDKMKSTNEELIEDLQAKGKQIGVLTEKLKIIDEIKNDIKRNKDDIETNKEKFNKDLATTKKELTRIDKRIATKSPDCNLLEKIGAKANIDNLESLVTHEKFKRLERQLAQQDKLTLEILLTPKCPFLWIIDNFKELFKAPLSEKGVLTSPTFFTEKGYRGRFRLYIKDLPQGKADQISVYFDNLKGPYDETLEWPMPFTSLNFTLVINGKEVSKASSKIIEKSKTWAEHFVRPIGIKGQTLGRPGFKKTLIEDLTDKDIVAIKFHTE